MFDIDAGKLLIIGVIALVVLGPKELPRVLRQVGSALGKMRRMASEFQGQFAEAMRESEMEDLKKNVQNIAESARVDINYNPAEIADREIRDALADKPASAPASAASASAQEAASFNVPAPPEIIDALPPTLDELKLPDWAYDAIMNAGDDAADAVALASTIPLSNVVEVCQARPSAIAAARVQAFVAGS
jgi:sec-independent protein translocase protein TatB